MARTAVEYRRGSTNLRPCAAETRGHQGEELHKEAGDFCEPVHSLKENDQRRVGVRAAAIAPVERRRRSIQALRVRVRGRRDPVQCQVSRRCRAGERQRYSL